MKILIVQTSQRNDVREYLENTCKENDVVFDCVEVHDDFYQCTSCGKCIKKRECVNEDVIHMIHQNEYDGLCMIGDTHYGKLDHKAGYFLQRLFRSRNEHWLNKVGSMILVSRRNHNEDAMNEIIQYYRLGNMIPVMTKNQNTCKDDMHEIDDVILQTIWLMKVLQYAKENGVSSPILSIEKVTDFVR